MTRPRRFALAVVITLTAPLALLGLPVTAAAVDGCATTTSTTDLDGDGFDDLAVGDPFADVGDVSEAGNVVVFFGDADGRIGEGRHRLINASTLGGTPRSGAQFGDSVAVGDVTGDGCADLLVGAPSTNLGDDEGAGVVHLITFAAPGADGTSDVVAVPITQDIISGGEVESSDGFGSTVAVVGTHDGLGVFAVTALGQRVNGQAYAGEVDLFGYDPGTGTVSGITRLAAGVGGVPGAAVRNGYFGDSLAAGRLPWPGGPSEALTLLIGAPGDRIDDRPAAGSVTAYEIGGAHRSRVWTQDSPGVGGAPENGDRFGTSIAIAAPTATQPGLLVVGVPGEGFPNASRTGMVHLFTFDDSTVDPGPALHQNVPGVPGASEPDDYFGKAVAIRPSDHLVAVSAPYEQLTSRARSWVQTFTYAAPTETITARTAYSGNAVGPGRIEGSLMGWDLAGVTGRNEDVLVVGAPSSDGGSVLLLSDDPAAPTRSWIADRLGIDGAYQLGWSVG